MTEKYQTRERYAARVRIVAVAVLLVGGCSSREAPAGPPKPHVSVANPIVREVIDWDDYVGRFEAVAGLTVMPPRSRPLNQNMFPDGSGVQMGPTRLLIPSPPFSSGL